MKNFLEGRWLGHPLHTLLVHLPVGFFLLSFGFDVAGYFSDWAGAVRAAFATMVAGVATALLAAIPGFADFAEIRRDSPAKRKARLHMILNLIAVALYGASLVFRRGSLEAEATPVVPFLVAMAAFGVLSFSGYLGGEIVYNEGVGVGRHRRKGPLPDETVERRGLPGEFVAVADAGDLPAGRSLRARINGAEIAVANVDGELHAFQDFCSHRYGPLSEGTFADGNVVCPWHHSCFDLRTGAVTKGPAKVAIKVFPVRIRNEKIEVQVEFEPEKI